LTASLDLRTAAEFLRDWSRQHRVVEVALARYRGWLAESGRHVIAEAVFCDQALVFRGHGEAFRPQVVTRFSLTSLAGLCSVGTLEVYTDLDGAPAGMRVSLEPGESRQGTSPESSRDSTEGSIPF
jgi:hypothetical protein